MNITLLQFNIEEDAGDERGKELSRAALLWIWVEGIDDMKHAIERHAGKYHPAPTAGPTPSISSATQRHRL